MLTELRHSFFPEIIHPCSSYLAFPNSSLDNFSCIAQTPCFDARLIRGLVGTTVTTYDLVSEGASLESTSLARTWIITEKLSERANPQTYEDVKRGYGSPKTVGKSLCHLAEDPEQIGFMRIYKQIPITGTEDADNDTLARQTVPRGVCGELECFNLLQSGGCSAVPRFLGQQEVLKESTTSFLAATLDTGYGERSLESLRQRSSSGA